MAKKIKQIFYRLTRILSVYAQYVMLIGERSNGKSYAVKEYCINDYFTNNNKFVYLRRWREDITAKKIEKYFDDMTEVIIKATNGECDCITAYSGSIYAGKRVEKLKIERKYEIGFAMCLTGETHYKSMAFPDYFSIIFEEFITKTIYLPDECDTLMSLVSTVLRRRKGRVFMIGNTIKRNCPYFREWQLTGILKMKEGKIDVYTYNTDQHDEEGNQVQIKIAVEYCENTSKNSQMFFGSSAKMITAGQWDRDRQRIIPWEFKSCDKLYTMIAEQNMLSYSINLMLKADQLFLYVYPYSGDMDDIKMGTKIRTIGHDYPVLRPLADMKFIPRNRAENVIKDLMRRDHIYYSDSLTGTEFKDIYPRL